MSSRLLRLLHKNENVSRMLIFDNLATNKRPITHCGSGPKDVGAVKAAVEGCESINHLAAGTGICKAVTLEELNVE
jgi:hypothetical protein